LSRWKDEYHTSFLEPLTEAKLAYLAGIVDGEGFFQVSLKTNTFGLGVGVTDRVLIEWLRREIGGRAYFDISHTAGNRLVHRWFVSRQADLLSLLPELRPYLVIKQEQCDAMLGLVEHLRAYPAYDVPTKYATRAERARRKEIADAWREEGKRLRGVVREARYAPVAA
jgi:hypothetical protein